MNHFQKFELKIIHNTDRNSFKCYISELIVPKPISSKSIVFQNFSFRDNIFKWIKIHNVKINQNGSFRMDQNELFQMHHFKMNSIIGILIFWENSKLSRLQTNGPTVLGPPNSFEAFDGNSLRVSVLTYSLTMFLL